MIEAWTGGTSESEVVDSLRVLYVAATRARQLLAIALPAKLHEVVRTYLHDQNVTLLAS